ncbi:uncharacterized protein LOC131077222 [Cryptomeria japonica]|uniref:uncharacterized protein LOC131077222 n=1 Tax=Cryptomeria japonica TaxID=3369 RepID=UPI0027DA7213|nr:uncharacterized protein LOC131077222 [Cryptomeria japonica]
MLESRACIKAHRVLRQHYSVTHWLGKAVTCGFHAQSSAAHGNATACYHSNCTNIAMHQRKFNFSTMLTGFMQASKNQGEDLTDIKSLRTIPVETEVLSDEIGELQFSYDNDATKTFAGNNSRFGQKEHPRKRVGFGEETNILIDIVLKLNDSKEAVYGTLDSWVAQEATFPSNVLKRALYMLEKKQQWHRIIQLNEIERTMSSS